MAEKDEGLKQHVAVKAYDKQIAVFRIEGDAPFVQHKFPAKAMRIMIEKHEAGSQQAKKKAAKPPRNFDDDYKGAMRVSRDGWCGIAAPSFRNAMIRACTLVGFTMTQAKMSVFIEADGYDTDDGMPLVRIYGDPHKHTAPVRNATGVIDIRVRPMWQEWHANLRIRFDGDQFTLQDVTNLLYRAGQQVGIGEGRPFSKESAGIGWGTFRIAEEAAEKPKGKRAA